MLRVEAIAPDGQIEAVSLPEARFVVGVQWHPEYKVLENPLSRALFGMFAKACHHAPFAGVAVAPRAA
jgi:gamma-glutamyl-gamma-aminobutyrate hydrolase PuuD